MTEIQYGGARCPGDKTATEIEGMRIVSLRQASQTEVDLLELRDRMNCDIAEACGIPSRMLPQPDFSHLFRTVVS